MQKKTATNTKMARLHYGVFAAAGFPIVIPYYGFYTRTVAWGNTGSNCCKKENLRNHTLRNFNLRTPRLRTQHLRNFCFFYNNLRM